MSRLVSEKINSLIRKLENDFDGLREHQDTYCNFNAFLFVYIDFIHQNKELLELSQEIIQKQRKFNESFFKKNLELYKNFKLLMKKDSSVTYKQDQEGLVPSTLPKYSSFVIDELKSALLIAEGKDDTEWTMLKNEKQVKDCFAEIRIFHSQIIWNLETLLSPKEKKSLKSIYLITDSIVPNVVFLVVDKHFDMPIRYDLKNKEGKPTAIMLLYNILYPDPNAPNKRVDYSKDVANNINNGLFKREVLKKYMKTNELKKPTLVQKSEKNILVLKGEVNIEHHLIKDFVPTQHKLLYIDKTK